MLKNNTYTRQMVSMNPSKKSIKLTIEKFDVTATICLGLLALVSVCALWFLQMHPVSCHRGDAGCEEGTSVLHVCCYGFLTAVSTGGGVAPFFFLGRHGSIPRWWLGVSNCIAAGMMLSASLGLITEGVTLDPLPATPLQLTAGLLQRTLLEPWARTVGGGLLGLVFIFASKGMLDEHEDLKLEGLTGMDARKALLLIGVMTLHSFSEGVGIGVSFGGGAGHRMGPLISTALCIHNVPEGLAVALVLVPRGVSRSRAALWCILTSMPQPLMALPAYLFVEHAQIFLPIGLGFAAGAMIWMVFTDLIPEARRDMDSSLAMAFVVLLAALGMSLVQHIVA